MPNSMAKRLNNNNIWPKPRTLTSLNAGEDVEQRNSHSLLMGTQNGAVTL